MLVVSKTTIALTVTARSTSLPEIAATVVAVIKRESSLTLDNVIGSNLLNLGLVLGVSALVVPLDNIQLDAFSIAWFIGLTALVFYLGVVLKLIPRWVGSSLVASYAGYVFLLTL